MFLDKLLHKIGEIFSGLFNAARKAWKQQSPEVQNALLHASAVVEAINSNVDAAPDFIIDLLQDRYPNLTKEKIHEGLTKVASVFKIGQDLNDPDLETLIKKLQEYLGSLEGKVWAAISFSISSVFAIVTAPPETKFSKISLLLEYVYQKFIKKDA